MKTPISEKRLSANRANAVRSTGPRTDEGKARSAQNARKHGFTASNFSVLRLEDPGELDALRAEAIHVYRPLNAEELFRSALRVWTAAGYRAGVAALEQQLARVAARAGRYDDALRLYEHSRAEFRAVGDRTSVVETDIASAPNSGRSIGPNAG